VTKIIQRGEKKHQYQSIFPSEDFYWHTKLNKISLIHVKIHTKIKGGTLHTLILPKCTTLLVVRSHPNYLSPIMLHNMPSFIFLKISIVLMTRDFIQKGNACIDKMKNIWMLLNSHHIHHSFSRCRLNTCTLNQIHASSFIVLCL
jgi:hypothetical protein